MIEPITLQESEVLARSFLSFQQVTYELLSPELHEEFLTVWSFQSHSYSRKVWLIGGRAPYLVIDDDRVSNAYEALVVYIFMRDGWLHTRGDPGSGNEGVGFYLPPDWCEMAYPEGYKKSNMNAVATYITWKLLPSRLGEIGDPDIREICKQIGILQ